MYPMRCFKAGDEDVRVQATFEFSRIGTLQKQFHGLFEIGGG